MVKCRRMKRQKCMSKNWTYSWLWKSSKTRQQYCRLESFSMKTDILMNGSMVKNHISLKTGFGYSATRRTSFHIVVPGLSNSSSGSDSSTSRTLSRQVSHCSTSSSSSSSSPTESDTKTREREDRIESDISPVTVLTKVDDRGNPLQTCWGAQQEVKGRRCQRISCFVEGVYTSRLCISRFLSEKIYSTWRRKIGIKRRRQILPRAPGIKKKKKSGKKGSIARNNPKVWTSWA